ncbi:hypothetical protein ABID16_000043 [Rhizobium aquaticum]|uniref:Phage tail protein n=1 Tax=Rhizobium aquaticum TaxID=1549636 RepID=A0ABV2ITG6_9HYPH
MTASWPNTLPQHFLREDFAGTSPDNLVASEMSIGPAKVRRRSTAAVSTMNGSMVMTDAEFTIFEAFVANDLAGRAKAFNFPHPRGGAPVLVRMTKSYTWVPDGIEWRVSIQLEVLP